MAKKKKPKCPECGEKRLTKVRGQEERYCQECGYREPILQAPDQPKDQPMVEVQSEKKSQEEQTDQQTGSSGDSSDHIQQMKRKPAPGDNISRGLLQHPRVFVHCWSKGPGKGFKYGTRCPYPNTAWTVETTGAKAFAFLNQVKRANRHNKLESGRVLDFN